MKQFWSAAVAVVAFGGLGVSSLLRPSAVAPADATLIQAGLDALPMVVGVWNGVTEPYPDRALKQAEAAAAVSRVYTRDDPPAKVGVLILAGRPGPIGAHDPAVCFVGAGFRPTAEASRKPVGPDALWMSWYDTAGTRPTSIQVCWGWSGGGRWAACDNARLEFADRGVVYKLYVTRALPPGGGAPGGSDPTDEFLTAFLPATQPLAGPTPAARP